MRLEEITELVEELGEIEDILSELIALKNSDTLAEVTLHYERCIKAVSELAMDRYKRAMELVRYHESNEVRDARVRVQGGI